LFDVPSCGKMIAGRDVECMNFYETPNSARRINDVMKERAKQREQMLFASQAAALEEGARQRKIDNAQLDSAENLRKMLEMMEANQKEQAIESKKTKIISIWGLIISGITLAATIMFGMLQVIR
jgi:hypothetical protein